MTARFCLIDVKSATCGVPRENFQAEDIEAIADSILLAGMLVQPLLVTMQEGIKQYHVFESSALAYWGAVRARELDPRQGEMVAAIALDGSSILTAQVQVAVVEKNKAKGSKTASIPITSKPKAPKTSTVKELRERCKTLKIKGYSKLRKAELIALIASTTTQQAA